MRLTSSLRLLWSTVAGNVALALVAGSALGFALVHHAGTTRRAASAAPSAVRVAPARPPLSAAPTNGAGARFHSLGATNAPSAPGVYPLGDEVTSSAVAGATFSSGGALVDPVVGFTVGGGEDDLGDPIDDGFTPPAETTTTETTTETTAETTTAAPLPPLEISDVRALALSPFSATIAWHTSEAVASRVAYGIDATAVWTPAAPATTDHVATLTGLAFDTTYRISVDARAVDGRSASVPFLLNTPSLTGGVTTSTAGGALLVDGQPFFPTIVWKACADNVETQLAAGIDLFMGNGCGDGHAMLQRLGGRAFSIADAHGPAVSGPGVAGTFLPDEWDEHLPGTLTNDEAARLATPTMPGLRFLTLTNHFYSHAEPLPQGRRMYGALVQNAEVLGFDLYPMQGWCRYDSFGDVYEAQREIVQLAQGKPTFQWIEARRMDCRDPRLDPTPETVRAETWLAVAGGANGIGYFPFDWDAQVGQEIAREKRELETLAPALTEPPLPADSNGMFVKVGAREHNGAIYVIAVNASRAPVSDTIVVPSLGDRSIVSLDGTRSGTAAAGAFTDTFGPLEVHIYVSAPTTL